MSAAMRAPAWEDWDRTRAGLWTVSFAVMMALHVAALALALLWRPQEEQAAPPPAAMMIELAPMAAAARPVEKVVEEPPRPEPVKKAEVPLPKPKPKPEAKPKPKPKTMETPPPTETATETPPVPAPATAKATATPKVTAPAPGAAPSPPSTALPTWQGALRAHLERYKRYPPAAQSRRQQGVSYIRFSMNRDGTVLSARLERTSGFSRLDDESLALMERAQPLPPPPSEIPGNPIEIVVPIEFFLK